MGWAVTSSVATSITIGRGRYRISLLLVDARIFCSHAPHPPLAQRNKPNTRIPPKISSPILRTTFTWRNRRASPTPEQLPLREGGASSPGSPPVDARRLLTRPTPTATVAQIPVPFQPSPELRNKPQLNIPSKITAANPRYCYHLAESPSGRSRAVPTPGSETAGIEPRLLTSWNPRITDIPPNAARIAGVPTHFHPSLVLRHKPNMGIHNPKK